MKRVLSITLSLLFILMAFTGCKTEKPNSSDESNLAEIQEYKVHMDNDPASLDPQLCVDTNGGAILGFVTEPLVYINSEGKYYAGLAETWEISKDEEEYVFHLRDAKWSDGEDITAKDFEYSWFRAIDPVLKSGNSYRFFNIVGAEDYFTGKITDKSQVGIKAVDEKTLKITLKKPTPYFMSLALGNAFRPMRQDIVEKYGTEFASTPDKMVYSGPFKITNWTRQQELLLEKNENYWNAKNLKLNKIVYNIIQDPQVILQMYESGELDEIPLDASLLDKYRESKELTNVMSTNLAFVSYNCKNEFFSNLSLRKAFSMTIDRDSFTNKVLNNGAKSIRGFVPYGFPGGSGDKDFRSHNGDLLKDISTDTEAVSKEAQDLLDQGLTEIGKSKEALQKAASILVFDEEGKKQAQVMQQSYKKYFGLDLKIEQLTLKVIIDRMFKGDYSMIVIGFSGFYIDPMAYLENFTSTAPMNTALWSDPEYDALIKKAHDTAGDERMNYLYEAEKMLMEKLPITPVYNRAVNYLTKPYVKGIERSAFYGSDVNKIYIEKH